MKQFIQSYFSSFSSIVIDKVYINPFDKWIFDYISFSNIVEFNFNYVFEHKKSPYPISGRIKIFYNEHYYTLRFFGFLNLFS